MISDGLGRAVKLDGNYIHPYLKAPGKTPGKLRAPVQSLAGHRLAIATGVPTGNRGPGAGPAAAFYPHCPAFTATAQDAEPRPNLRVTALPGRPAFNWPASASATATCGMESTGWNPRPGFPGKRAWFLRYPLTGSPKEPSPRYRRLPSPVPPLCHRPER